MVLHFLARFFILSLFCVAICCIRFYLFQNSKLVSDTKLKRIVLKSKPTECLGECVHLDQCKSFNVIYNESRGLICDLFSISNSTLQKDSFTMHFTVNELASTQLSNEARTEATTDSTTFPATNPTKTVNPNEESIYIVKKNDKGTYCVSLTQIWILQDISSKCQLFYFIDGGALRLQDRRCARIDVSQVVFSTNPCDSFTFSKNQFQHTKTQRNCIRFLENTGPVFDNCDKTFQYKKEKVTGS